MIKYNRENKSHKDERMKQYYQKNKEERLKKQKEYYEKNKDAINAKLREKRKWKKKFNEVLKNIN